MALFSFRGLAALALVSFAPSAHALIEARVGYQTVSSSPSDLNSIASVSQKISAQAGLVADIMANLPLVPFGVGVRYELLSQSLGDTASGQLKTQVTRTSAVFTKRIIDTILYLGPVITISPETKFTYDYTSGSTTTSYKASAPITASAGIETGLKLGFFNFGAEAGYLYAPLGNAKDSAGADALSGGSTLKVDMSGVYARGTLGIGF